MEGMLSASDQQRLVSSFLEIAVGQTAETARQFLQATSWRLEEAIPLFYAETEGNMFSSASQSPVNDRAPADQSWGDVSAMGTETPLQSNVHEAEVRPPLPVVRETLYGDSIALRNLIQETSRPRIWESEREASSTSAAAAPRDNLASLYSPPFRLMFHGSFEQAKWAASTQDKWLLVNLQSMMEFSSHVANRDVWANDVVAETVSSNFVFWLVYDNTTEGQKVCTFYKLESVNPVVLVIDPITGRKMRSWCGIIEPEALLEDLTPYMDAGPREHLASPSTKHPKGSSLTPSKLHVDDANGEDEELQQEVAASLESMRVSEGKIAASPKKLGETCSTNNMPTYPKLPEEPKSDCSLLCRVGVRLPNGQRVQRNFLKSEPIQLLWSFCYSQLEESPERKPFKLTLSIPGALKTLEYESNLTFEQSGLANSMISVTWK